MKRNLSLLPETVYDVCVIGGGIYGVCVAWDAILRGLSVVLLDKGDFGCATSSNTLRVIHGGFRYLQNGDVGRMRESIRERMMWMRIAPHLVHPVPFLIPIYTNSSKGKMILSTALFLYDLISFDRNRLKDPQKNIPRGKVISKEECLQLVPGVDDPNLKGAAIFHDGQMHNSERLLLSTLKAAANAGAVMANYVEVTGFLKNGDRVIGVKAKDVLSGQELDVGARIVVNTSGPWLNQVLDRLNGPHVNQSFFFSKAINLVVNRIFSKYAVALQGPAGRLFFITPWHNHSLIGTAHLPYHENPDEFSVTEKDIESFVGEINQSLPNISLRNKDVVFWHGGLVPAKRNCGESRDVQPSRHCQILDHHTSAGLQGLISVVGVKFTEARSVAEKVVNRVFEKLGQKPPKAKSGEMPIYGGSMDCFNTFLAQAIAQRPSGLTEGTMRHLILNYGSAYPEVLKYIHSVTDRPQITSPDKNSEVLMAEVLYAIREEMAHKLGDVLFRRTDVGSLGYPGDACLTTCVDLMSKEIGWNQAKSEQELKEVKEAFSFGTAHA